jgi:glycosyltransferase involved in cell wall biosynthesis
VIVKIDFNNTNHIVILIFGLAFLIQLIYYLVLYLRVAVYKTYHDKASKTPVSVIICAKNEAVNLRTHLPSVLEQDYPDYEVIVVNDCSTDDTDMVLSEFVSKYKHLRVTSIEPNEKFTHGKKLAITIGIKAAKNEWLLFTDADCMPASDKWISEMQSHFTDHTDFVLGYGGYKPKISLLNSIIRYETFFIALQYFSYALAKLPYMGVGRNMAYRKSKFFNSKGFSSHLKLLSGDDDLFVNENATKKNVKVCISATSITISEPEMSIVEWIKQKLRHLTTGNHYKFQSRFLLGTEYISRILFYGTFSYLLMKKIYPNYFFYPLILRSIVHIAVVYPVLQKLKEKYLLLPSLLYDLILPIFNICLFLYNYLFPRKNKW